MISRTDPVIKTIDDLLFPQVQRYYFFSKSNNSMSLAPCEKNPVTP